MVVPPPPTPTSRSHIRSIDVVRSDGQTSPDDGSGLRSLSHRQRAQGGVLFHMNISSLFLSCFFPLPEGLLPYLPHLTLPYLTLLPLMPSFGRRLLFATACVLSTSPCHSAEFGVSTKNLSCGGDFEITSLDISCDGGTCEFGKDVSLSGTVTINNDISEERGSVKISLLSNMVTIYSSDNFDPCRGLKSESGSTCASAGEYSFDETYKIPGNDNAWYSNLMFSSYFNIYASFEFDGSSSYCQVAVKASKGGYQMSSNNNTLEFVGGAFAIVGLATFLSRRRRRAVALVEIQDEDKRMEAPQSNFEMMPEAV